jgi:hypothetical protein
MEDLDGAGSVMLMRDSQGQMSMQTFAEKQPQPQKPPSSGVLRRTSVPSFRMAAVQRDLGQTEAPATVHEVLRSPGQPLDPVTQSFMESRFHYDFGQVRVHTDAQAAESARAVGAVAYTVGPALVFDAGRYAPATSEGRRLLAHELAHTIQQGTTGSERVQRQPRPTPLPPGEGQYSPKEYEVWLHRHQRREYLIGGPWEPDSLYARYTPKWFHDHGYYYAGRGGNLPWNWFEVWLSDSDGGKEYRVWRTADANATKTPDAAPSSPAPQQTPGTPTDVIDPKADREKLFGPVIAAREDVDAGFGEGDTVLYADGTVELFVRGTTQSYVFRPVPGGGYKVYEPSGRRFDNNTWHIFPEAIPDPVKDAVE